MARLMPDLERFFHYRNLDVSTLKELARRWFPDLAAGSVESRLEEVSANPQWRKSEPEADSDATVEIPGRPGVFAYLKLIAIVNEPEPAALLRSENLPDKLAEQLLVSLDEKGLVKISEGEMIATGTIVNAGRTVWIAEAILSDDRGRQLGRGSGTFMRSRLALSEAMGYSGQD